MSKTIYDWCRYCSNKPAGDNELIIMLKTRACLCCIRESLKKQDIKLDKPRLYNE